MKRLLVVITLVTLAACSSDKSSTTKSADTGVDASTTDASGQNPGTDTGMTPDMAASTPDMSVASDMSSDAGMDVSDAMVFPDVPAQNCAYPSSDPMCPMGDFGPGTFLDHVEIADPKCCRDFTGDGVADNKIGKYVQILKGAGTDVNANIDAAVQAGALVYLFDYANWTNETYDSNLTMRIFLGKDNDTDFTDNLAGIGDFYVLPSSYDQSGAPKWVFNSATVFDGHLVATGGEIQLFFPGLLDDVQMILHDVRIEADVVPGTDLQAAGRVALEKGTLSGALDRQLFYSSMNVASNGCACLGKDVFSYDASSDKWMCQATTTDQTNCQNDANSGCVFLSNKTDCQFLELASGDVDVDTNGDGTPEDFSVGMKFTGVGATILGRSN